MTSANTTSAKNPPEARTTRATDGAPLHYEVAGTGEPIVFLHGGLTSRFTWRLQRDALADEFQVILRDLRGHDGEASVVPEGFGFDTTEIDDMVAVLDAEGLDRVHLVGHSTGGAIAVFFALKYPGRVGRMVLLEPTLTSLVAREVVWADPAGYEALAMATVDGGRALIDLAMGDLASGDWRASMSARSVARIDAQAAINVAHMLAFDRLNLTEVNLRSLATPMLALYGDNSLPVEPYIRAAIERIRPDIECRTIAGAGHNIHLDQPATVASAVRDFVNAS